MTRDAIAVVLQPGELVFRTNPGVAAQIEREVRHQTAARAWFREQRCRRLAQEALPARLCWLVDHPRVLRVVYRLRPSWRPVLIEHLVDLG